ncbi:unnamed protein product, partial [Rotaria sp. Silwood1]
MWSIENGNGTNMVMVE